MQGIISIIIRTVPSVQAPLNVFSVIQLLLLLARNALQGSISPLAQQHAQPVLITARPAHQLVPILQLYLARPSRKAQAKFWFKSAPKLFQELVTQDVKNAKSMNQAIVLFVYLDSL